MNMSVKLPLGREEHPDGDKFVAIGPVDVTVYCYPVTAWLDIAYGIDTTHNIGTCCRKLEVALKQLPRNILFPVT